MDLLGRARTFVRVVEAGSLSGAARSLGLSLPAISRQLATLEEELEAQLIERTTRSLHLTAAGQRFHEHATRLVHEADAARESVKPDRTVSGRVLLSASVALGVLRIVPTTPKLFAAHPGLELVLRLEDRAADVISEGVDIAIRGGLVLPDTTRLVAQSIATFRNVLVASPSYLRRHGTPRTGDALSKHRVVLGTSAGREWQFVENGKRLTVSLAPALRVDTLLGRRAAVIAGVGIALLPEFVVEADITEGALRALLPRSSFDAVTVHALYRIEMRGTPRIEAVIAHLRATVPLVAEAKKSPH